MTLQKPSICARGKVNRNRRQVPMVRYRSIQAEAPGKHEVIKPRSRHCTAAASPSRDTQPGEGLRPVLATLPTPRSGNETGRVSAEHAERLGLSLPVGLPCLPLSARHGTRRAGQGLRCAASCSPWKHAEMPATAVRFIR